ncbi:hypothetical protein AAF712_016869, partial [Marasmius tenuissimus]
MKDESKNKEKFHITSKVADGLDSQALFQLLMDKKVECTVAELLGASPALAKLMNESTRTRRDYYTKSAEYSHDTDSPCDCFDYSTSKASFVDDDDDIETVEMVLRENATDSVYKLSNLTVDDANSVFELLAE